MVAFSSDSEDEIPLSQIKTQEIGRERLMASALHGDQTGPSMHRGPEAEDGKTQKQNKTDTQGEGVTGTSGSGGFLSAFTNFLTEEPGGQVAKSEAESGSKKKTWCSATDSGKGATVVTALDVKAETQNCSSPKEEAKTATSQCKRGAATGKEDTGTEVCQACETAQVEQSRACGPHQSDSAPTTEGKETKIEVEKTVRNESQPEQAKALDMTEETHFGSSDHVGEDKMSGAAASLKTECKSEQSESESVDLKTGAKKQGNDKVLTHSTRERVPSGNTTAVASVNIHSGLASGLAAVPSDMATDRKENSAEVPAALEFDNIVKQERTTLKEELLDKKDAAQTATKREDTEKKLEAEEPKAFSLALKLKAELLQTEGAETDDSESKAGTENFGSVKNETCTESDTDTFDLADTQKPEVTAWECRKTSLESMNLYLNPRWHLVCAAFKDWKLLADSLEQSHVKCEKELYKLISEEFLPRLPSMFEKVSTH